MFCLVLIDVLLLENKHSGGLPAVELDYMIVGQKELCEPGTKLFKLAEQKAGFAPSLSFLHDIESHVIGIHYIDQRGYVISLLQILTLSTFPKHFGRL